MVQNIDEQCTSNFSPPKSQISIPIFFEIGTLKRTFRVRVLFKMFVVLCFISCDVVLLQ